MWVYRDHFVKDDHVFLKLFYDIHYSTIHLHVGFGDHIFLKYCVMNLQNCVNSILLGQRLIKNIPVRLYLSYSYLWSNFKYYFYIDLIFESIRAFLSKIKYIENTWFKSQDSSNLLRIQKILLRQLNNWAMD